MDMNRHQRTSLQTGRKMKLCRAEGIWPGNQNKEAERKAIFEMPADKCFCGLVKQSHSLWSQIRASTNVGKMPNKIILV